MQGDIQLLALLCGHFLGDFVFQSDRLAELKSTHLKWMIFHVFQVSLLTWLFLGNLTAWWIAGLVFLVHLSIDFAKIRASETLRPHQSGAQKHTFGSREDTCEADAGKSGYGKDMAWLIGDQLVHVLALITLWYCLLQFHGAVFLENRWEVIFGLHYAKGLLLLTGLAIGIFGVAVVLKYQMSEFVWNLGERAKQGLPKGGKTIGILERLLVFMFVLAGKPEGVGFVIAAKSVFRIGELTDKEDKDHAEYIMIGTLRSFTYALAAAFMTKWFIDHI